MLKVFYEDQDVIVVKKPVGTESQAVHSFAPDMVSEIKKHIHRLSTENGERRDRKTKRNIGYKRNTNNF